VKFTTKKLTSDGAILSILFSSEDRMIVV